MSGWIRLHRGWRECDVFGDGPASEREAWIHLIEIAAWKAMVRKTGKGDIVNVGRGQLHTAERTLADMWLWDRKRVQRFLNRLQKCGMISVKSGPSGSLITICNYESYQGDGSNEGSNGGSNHGSNHGSNQGSTQEEVKKDKKGKEEKKSIPAARASSDYRFAGDTIRLTQEDFDKWSKAYSSIPDLGAELLALDGWWQSQTEDRRKNWFYATSGMLNRKHQELTKKQAESQGDHAALMRRLALEAKRASEELHQ